MVRLRLLDGEAWRPSERFPPRSRVLRLAPLLALLALPAPAATPWRVAQFDPTGGTVCSVAVEDATGDVWLYICSAGTVDRYTSGGVFVGSVARPGESANDVDVDFTAAPVTLASTSLPAGTLLFVNGETGVADIYALSNTGTVLATLASGFGVSHVVGGSHHPGRTSLFMVQDAVPPDTANDNLVAEVDPASGAVVGGNTFYTTTADPTFTVNYGDVDVCPQSGNLFVVSSDENNILELTPTGTHVANHPLPNPITGLSGIAIGAASGRAVWVSSTSGAVYGLAAFPCGLVFADNFESNGTTNWSAQQPP